MLKKVKGRKTRLLTRWDRRGVLSPFSFTLIFYTRIIRKNSGIRREIANSAICLGSHLNAVGCILQCYVIMATSCSAVLSFTKDDNARAELTVLLHSNRKAFRLLYQRTTLALVSLFKNGRQSFLSLASLEADLATVEMSTLYKDSELLYVNTSRLHISKFDIKISGRFMDIDTEAKILLGLMILVSLAPFLPIPQSLKSKVLISRTLGLFENLDELHVRN